MGGGLLGAVKGYQARVQYLLNHTRWCPGAPYDDYLPDLDAATDAELRVHLANLKDVYGDVVQHINGQELYNCEFSAHSTSRRRLLESLAGAATNLVQLAMAVRAGFARPHHAHLTLAMEHIRDAIEDSAPGFRPALIALDRRVFVADTAELIASAADDARALWRQVFHSSGSRF